jgi:Mn2+/Fe2+ NRAMP family transporter
MRALYISAAVNGIIAVPILVFMMILARRRSVMGRFVIPWGPVVIGWIATLAMTAAAAMLIGTWSVALLR